MLRPLNPVRGLYDWFDRRLNLTPVLERLLYDPVPERGGWFYTFGGALFALILIQFLTGIFLVMYYVPSWDQARGSVLYIQNEVLFGWLVRGIHYWNMVILVLLIGIHLVRTFVSAAFKTPRELNWVLGVTLLLLMVAEAFTGGCLVGDQAAYFDMVVGTTIAGWTPFIGPYLGYLWRGGEMVNPVTLTRTFSLHIWFLPPALIILAAVHTLLVIIVGQFGSWVNYEPEGPEAEPETPDQRAARGKLEREILSAQSRKVNLPTRVTWFFPYHLFKEASVTLLLFAVVFALSLIVMVPIEDPVDPATTTYAPSSMWFLLFQDQLLLLFPGLWLVPLGATVVPGATILILYLFPWIEHDSQIQPAKRIASIAFLFALVTAIIVLTLLAASRVYNFLFVNTPP